MNELLHPHFDAFFQPYWVNRVLKDNISSYAETVVYQLTAGCIKLEASIFHAHGISSLGYDVYIKSRPEDGEWIAYDTLTEPANLDVPDMQQEMCRVLADYLGESGLSCEGNPFKIVEGNDDHE